MINLPENYKERPIAPELDLVSRMDGRFKGTREVMPKPQRNMYTNIMNKFDEYVKRWKGYPKQIHKPKVVDVGCGLGVGANILSQQAGFVWGIDTNEESINFAKQMFERARDNIYYNPQLTFDVVDVMDESRDLDYFDYVTCIELIEHLPSENAVDVIKFLNRFVRKTKKGAIIEDETRTVIFVSSPNRNSPKIQDDTPGNEHHCFEGTAGEMYEFFTKHYKHVTVLDEHMEPQELDTQATPLLFKLEVPID